ncbi:DUF3325 domain-containing protein [Shewanella colwelliana]|uniref:DUF3325 domain-containing protein n=1 Tax=Shewanella colwelliana TaxID=23 RepID=UPI0022AF6D91|nr:DUF3325 domain-containing protein [Shewanella colwelliana]MCZ4338567.1 DUF3325 domain-containing protein [Shewanella colwelliana]
MIVSIMSVSYIGLGLFALSMFTHFRDALKRTQTETQQHLFKLTGGLVLIGSYAAALTQYGGIYGTLILMGILTVSALLVILTLSYRPKALPFTMLICTICSGGQQLLF